MSHRGCYKSRENVSGLFFDCFGFFSFPIRVSKATLLPPSILPPNSKESRQAENRTAPLKCVHTQSNHLGVLHTFWMQCCRGGKEGILDFFISFFFHFSFFFFILRKEGTKSQPSFKPSAAWELSVSQKASVSTWEPSPHLSLLFLRVCACICTAQVKGPAQDLCTARESKAVPGQGKWGEEESAGLNRPFSNVRTMEVTCDSPHCFSKSRPGRALVLFEVIAAFACARLGVMQEGQNTYPGVATLNQCSLGEEIPALSPALQMASGSFRGFNSWLWLRLFSCNRKK